jgi:DNA-binding PadR family transcriptional regulator
MLELAILGLLGEQELHGYEIRKRLREELGFFSPVSFGSLYPALSRLERSGAVVSAEEPGESVPAAPMTGSLSGERAALRARRSAGSRGRRGRKVYRITDEGQRQFAALLDGNERDTGADDARSFGLRLAFARYLPPAARLRLLERRRAQLVQRLDEVRQATVTGRRALDPYARSVVEHAAESTERDISWLDRLIAAERGPSAPTASGGGPGAGLTSLTPAGEVTPDLEGSLINVNTEGSNR